MDVFFTSVVDATVGAEANAIYYPMRLLLKKRLGSYGDGLSQWFLIFCILDPSGPGGDRSERVLWKKKSRELDMRLDVDFEAFKSGTEAERRKLLVACMRRSLGLMEGKKIPDFDVAGLKRDFEQIVKEEGWEQG